jgi:D-hexose-6-phosphate mutarotase
MNSKAAELTTGKGNLPMLKIHAPRSEAEIYLHGAHLTHFKKTGEPPLLFVSRKSWFEADQPIRGGIPICFPWFGAREGGPSHGLARILTWELLGTSVEDNGSVKAHLLLPQKLLKPEWSVLRTEFIVTAGETLTMELITKNESPDQTLEIENCLHTYFHIGEIDAVSLTGLRDTMYLDNSEDGKGQLKTDNEPVLIIPKETNRLYLDTSHMVDIRDEKFQRTIRVEKWNSRSTVVWNPWTTQKLPEDFDPAEHRNMLCVEAGNIKQNKISLAPGRTTSLKVALSTGRLK